MNKQLLALFLLCLPVLAAADTAPTLSPTADQYVVIDSKASLTLTASGGTLDTPPPDPTGNCKWTKKGGIVYVFTYSKLSGSVSSGSDAPGSTLAIQQSTSGTTSVTVAAKQYWVASDGITMQSTTSAQSSATKVTVQKPKTLKYITVYSVNGGGADFVFEIDGDDGTPMKGMNLTLLENVAAHTGVITGDPGGPVPFDVNGITEGKSAQGTDGNGYFYDTPVSVTNLGDASVQQKENLQSSDPATGTFTHSYDTVVTPDGTNYRVTPVSQQQSIIENATYNPATGTSTVTTKATAK